MLPRTLALRDGGVFLVIDVDSRVNHERPPGQNGGVYWPLRGVANEDDTEQYNREQKGDGGPA